MTYFKTIFFILIYSLIALTPLFALDPKEGSPLKNGTHPRLHLTENTIPEIRSIIQNSFQAKYQDYVNWASSANDNEDTNILFEAGHDPTRALMLHQAFIAALGTVSGISYPISLDKYAERAINSLIRRLGSDELSYASALTVDWTWNYQTSSQRSQIANIMNTRTVTHKVFDHSISNPAIDPEQMFSSKYYEGSFPWYQAIPFWGTGLMDSDADNALNTFQDDMLNYGYLDAHNFVAGNDGGYSEWVGYTSWHPRTHMLNLDGWHTATGEDYISNSGTLDGNALKTYPKFMRYAMDPHKYFDQFYTYLRMGSAETTDPSFQHRSMREQIYYLPGVLHRAGLDEEAGLLRDMIDRYEVEWPTHEHQFLYPLLGIYTVVPKVTPEDLNFPHSLWAKNLGVFFARTGFSSPADGVFAAMDGHFRFDGHNGAEDYSGFVLTKFGTLINTRHVAHRNYGNLSEYDGGYEPNTVFFEGGHEKSHKTMDAPDELQAAAEGTGDFDWGGIEQIVRKDEYFYHVRSNRDRVFANGFSHQRDYVFLPGADPDNDSDFLVVYDRTVAAINSQSELPYKSQWVYHVPWKPEVSSYSSTQNITTGSGLGDRIGDRYSGSDILIKALNSTGGEKDSEGGGEDNVGGANAHGVAFVKTLLPKQIDVEVTRVAKFDSDVIKRQHNLAIKSHRWQVAVIPQQNNTVERYLNVFQTADANKVSSMTTTSLIEVGTSMHGTFIVREKSTLPNYAVLFNQSNGANTNVVTYSLNDTSETRHIITGLEPYTIYDIEYGGNKVSKVTEPDMRFWDYKGVDTNTKTGVLYFETTLAGSQTFKITKSGEQDFDAPGKPTGFNIKP
jgi:hypothetical protein